jgi:hypothetical protein
MKREKERESERERERGGGWETEEREICKKGREAEEAKKKVP